MLTPHFPSATGSFVNFYEIQEKYVICFIRNVTHSRKRENPLCNFVASNLTGKSNDNTGMKSLVAHNICQKKKANEFSNMFLLLFFVVNNNGIFIWRKQV